MAVLWGSCLGAVAHARSTIPNPRLPRLGALEDVATLGYHTEYLFLFCILPSSEKIPVALLEGPMELLMLLMGYPLRMNNLFCVQFTANPTSP